MTVAPVRPSYQIRSGVAKSHPQFSQKLWSGGGWYPQYWQVFLTVDGRERSLPQCMQKRSSGCTVLSHFAQTKVLMARLQATPGLQRTELNTFARRVGLGETIHDAGKIPAKKKCPLPAQLRRPRPRSATRRLRPYVVGSRRPLPCPSERSADLILSMAPKIAMGVGTT